MIELASTGVELEPNTLLVLKFRKVSEVLKYFQSGTLRVKALGRKKVLSFGFPTSSRSPASASFRIFGILVPVLGPVFNPVFDPVFSQEISRRTLSSLRARNSTGKFQLQDRLF